MKLDIIFQDEKILVINKPSGLIVHRTTLSSDRDTVVDRLKKNYKQPPAPVHRLDRPTSGVLLCAFDDQTARVLSAAFREGHVSKTYIAVVRGWVSVDGDIDIPLKNYDTDTIQDSLTHYSPLKRYLCPWSNNKYSESRYSLISISPRTGRMHQIRRHLARINHPIIGDTSHGDTRHNHLFMEYVNSNRLLLHASKLEISMEKKARHVFKASLHKPFTDVLEFLKRYEVHS